MENTPIKRYSEKDLTFFKAIIDKKLAKATAQLTSLENQLQEASADKGSESDWVDDSSNSTNLQLLNTMANRLRSHIVDLNNALLRIRNKSYGICSITGVLIDKKRLVAVPTTTKSVEAKNASNTDAKKTAKGTTTSSKKPKIITRVIPKTTEVAKNSARPSIADDDDQEDWDEADDLLKNVEQLDLNEELEE